MGNIHLQYQREMPHIDQDDFLVNLRNRNPRSFNVLYERYGTPLFNLAYRLTGSVTESEDILQETFIKVYESIDQFKQQAVHLDILYLPESLLPPSSKQEASDI